MSKQLYEEALADVKKLKEVAEDNAKRALLDAVTPRIKDLIENHLIGEATDAKPDEDEKGKVLHDAPKGGEDSDATAELDLETVEAWAEGKEDVDSNPKKKTVELSMESARSLGLLINSSGDIEAHITKLGRRIKVAEGVSRLVRETTEYKDVISSIISEVENTYSHLQSKKMPTAKKKQFESILENYYATLKGLVEQKMTNRRNRYSLLENDEQEIHLDLTFPVKDGQVDVDDIEVDVEAGAGGGDEGDEGDDDTFDFDEEGDESEDSDESDEEGDEEIEIEDEDEDEEESDDDEDEGSTQSETRWLGNNVLVEIDENMLRREIGRMRALREADETEPQSWGHGPGDVSDEFADDDMGDPVIDITLDEGDEDNKPKQTEVDAKLDEIEETAEKLADAAYDEGKDPTNEADDDEKMGGRHGRSAEQVNHQSRQPGSTVESLQRRIRHEVRVQMEAKQKAGQASRTQAKLQGVKGQIRQGKGRKKPQTDKQAERAMKKANNLQTKLAEVYSFFARRYNESVVRANRLRGLLSEAVSRGSVVNDGPSRSAGTSHLRTKLAETNLINTKLYFTNKLLQNESLTKRQKASVIERLDEARSDREVRLVYESLVRTLQGSSSDRLTESVNRGVMGSSSRPARPASTLNEGFETERWARLAGIVK